MSQEGKPESYLSILRKLKVMTSRGTVTESSRGFWGGVTEEGMIVITAWSDSRKDSETHYEFKRPRRTNGGLQAAWDDGRIRIGEAVRLIVIEPMDPKIPYGDRGRKVKSAELKEEFWRISGPSPDK
jgi:hypothetical protein